MTNKEDFIEFLIEKKYNKRADKKNLNIRDENLKNIISSYDREMDKESCIEFLVRLDSCLDNEEDLVYDYLFCLININQCLGKLIKDKNENKKFENVVTFYKKYFDLNKKLLKEFNNPSGSKDKPKSSTSNIQKRLVTRFPPEPSGCLHIGHVKAALVNWSIAEKSGGEMILRFDDTNPDKKYELFEDKILKDLEDLNIKPSRISHSSDYFDIIIDKAIFLIKKGLAYCDNTELERMRAERMDGIESKCRNTLVEENLNIFKDMVNGKTDGYCLRAKISVNNPNKALRDPVIFRNSKGKHFMTGGKYHAFPTYDFTCPIIDSVEGVTTACRTNEYRDRNQQYQWFLDHLELENKPVISDFSKLNFENTFLSKRKIEALISKGHVSGWDDPRLATIQGIKRAGMNMQALREYILLQGASHKTSTISWDKIWAMNKKVIDPISPRVMCIVKENAVTLEIDGISESVPFCKEQPLHKKNLELGTKKVYYDKEVFISFEDANILEEGEEFTLMNWGNVIIKDKNLIAKKIKVALHLEGDFKKTKNKISWISKLGSINVKGIEYSNLLISEDNGGLVKGFNTDSVKETWYLAESEVLKFNKIGTYIQMERIGFFICDKPFIWNLVPFTKQKRKF